MKKSIFFVALASISILLVTCENESSSSHLINDFCSKFPDFLTVTPKPNIKKLLPHTNLKEEINKLKQNGLKDNFPTYSVFGLIQALYPELQPNEALKLENRSNQECCVCLNSKPPLYFFEGCGAVICPECLEKLRQPNGQKGVEDIVCPICRLIKLTAFSVSKFQLEKSSYPFLAIPEIPKRDNFLKNIKDLYLSLVAWSELVEKLSSSKEKEWQTKTARILQIFNFFQNDSLLEIKEDRLRMLHLFLSYYFNALNDINPYPKKELSIKYLVSIFTRNELMKKYTEMEKSSQMLYYYISWMKNILIRKCYQISNNKKIVSL